MYRWVTKTERFDTDKAHDLARYDSILNSPLTVVLEKRSEKVSDKSIDSEGGITDIHERIVMVVTWKTKELL